MAEEEETKEDKLDFTTTGEGYIGLDQARVQAIEHARDNTDFYGPEYQGVRLVWEVVSTEETDDYYEIRLSFRPAGRYRGEPGIEQFIFDKTGDLRVRQLFDEPLAATGTVTPTETVAPPEPVAPAETMAPPEPMAPPEAVAPPETMALPEPVAPTEAVAPPEIVAPPEPGAETGVVAQRRPRLLLISGVSLVTAVLVTVLVLSTILSRSDKIGEPVPPGGLDETSALVGLRGAVIAKANAAEKSIDTVRFTLNNAAKSAAVELSNDTTVVTYLDSDQATNCTQSGSFDSDPNTSECSWSTLWIIGSGNLLDPGEQVDMTVTLTNLAPRLSANTEFTIQVRPNRGAVVIINRTTPAALSAITDLQ